MFAAFFKQRLIDAGHKTANSFHFTAYLVHAFVLLHSFFNFWHELRHDTSEEATTAIDPAHRKFMQQTDIFSFTQALNMVVYYSADRPVHKVRNIGDFSRPDMLR
jgi:high-affinity nickel permease